MNRIYNDLRYCKVGEIIYINAIALTLTEIDYLRFLIESKTLRVTNNSLKGVKEEYKKDFISGKSILPQADYIITKAV